MTRYHQSVFPDYPLPFFKKNVLQNPPTRIQTPHTYARLFKRGQSLGPKFSTCLERNSPWGDLGPRLRRL